MDAMEAILTRRSIRKYTDREVSEEKVRELLEAGMSAPSAGNQQPWQFIVIRDREILNAIPGIHPYSSMLRDAAVGIVVLGDTEHEKHQGYWVQDCAAATQNILLAAHAMGLGAVWLGFYPREDRVAGLQKLVGIPEGIVPLAMIAIGHPAEEKGKADRYNESRVHYDRW